MPTYAEFGATKLDSRVAGSNAAPPPEEDGLAVSLRKGFDSGMLGAGSQLNSLAGLAGENLGFDEFAAARNADAQRLQGEAQAAAPSITSYKQVMEKPSLRNAGNYLAGLVGGSAPVMGAGLVGGLATGGAGAIPAMLGAAAATAPFEIGDVIQKQNADPQAMQATPGARLRDAAFAGGASALAQGIVPGAVAGKIAGRGVGGVLKSNLAAIPVEGAAEGGGEAIKQLGANQGKPLDWEAIKENAVGGAAAGGAFGAVGAGADFVRGAAPGAGEALGSAAGALKARLKPQPVGEEVDAADAPAPTAFKSAWDDLQDLATMGKTKLDDSVKRVKEGIPLGDLKTMATAQGDRLAQMTDFSNSEGLKKATQWGEEMLNDAGLTPERRQAVTEAMTKVGDKAGQMAMAGLKEAQDRATTVMGKIKAFHDTWKRRDVDVEAREVPETKLLKSEDLRGATEAVVREIVPMLKKTNPDLVESADGINMLAPALVSTIKEMQKGPLSADRIARLIDLMGSDTNRVLVKLNEMFGAKDPAKVEAFFQQVQDIGEVQSRTDDLDQLVRKSLTPEAQDTMLSTDVPKIIERLRNITRGHLSELGKKSARGTVMTAEFRKFMTDHFGAAADTVSKAFEKEAKLGLKNEDLSGGKNPLSSDDAKFDDEGNRIEEVEPDVMTFGLTKPDKAGHSKSALNGLAMPEGSRYAKQHLSDLKAKYPGHDVRFERMPGSDHGHIVVENRTNPGEFNAADLKAMAHDTNSYYESPSRLEIGDHNIDAVRVAKVMGKKEAGKFKGDTDVSPIAHTVDMFKRGIAQLTTQFGKVINVPDDAVIGYSGKTPVTWGDAQRIVADTAEDRMSNGGKKKLAALRKVWKSASPEAQADILTEVQALMAFEKDRELTADLDSRETDAERHARKLDPTRLHNVKGDRRAKKNFEQPDPNETKNSAYDDEGYLTKAGAQMLMAGDTHGGIDMAAPSKSLHELDRKSHDSGQGRTEVGKDENIHLSSVMNDEKDLINRANMDGTGHSVSSYVPKEFAERAKEFIANMRKWDKSAPAKAIAKRAKTLIESMHSMTEVDQHALLDLRKLSAGDATPEINRLAKKYKAVVSESKKPPIVTDVKVKGASAKLRAAEGTPDPKAVAAKKAAFLERARSGDATLIESLKTSTDAKGLQRAVEALYDVEGADAALQAANDRLGELVQDPDVAYNLNTRKYSAQSTGTGPQNPNSRAGVAAYLDRVLGTSVRRAWANLTHAGEFDTVTNTIRLSIHALDPMSVAYHESLHAFFKQLKDTGNDSIAHVLLKASESRHVIDQMTAFFAHEPNVLAQLAEREERAAYMYQMWAAGQLTVSPPVRSLFQRIAKYIRELMGVWSNDERALHIMEYFNTGEYAQNMGQPNAVRRALMEPGRNQAYETAKSFTEPMAHIADAIVSTGSGRMRDTGVPSLIKLADIIKREHTVEGGDQGYIAAARIEGTKRRTAMGETLKSFSKETLDTAMEALHNGTHSLDPNVRDAQDRLKAILRRTKNYMHQAGVDLGDLGPDYFPRVWDTHYISKHQQEFLDMLAPYERAGHGSAQSMLNALMSHEGNEFQVETNIPGMQFTKKRLWNFITPQDASRFVSKDLMGTMSSYITQATRRAEWERRLGGGKLEAMFNKARQEGATDDDLKLTTDYLKGVDGTLGDSLNPTARRLMGNMIVYQNVRLLPLAVFSSIVDPLGVMVRGGTLGDAWTTFKRGVSEIPANFGRKTRDDEAARMAELVGVVDSAMLTHTMGDLYTQGMVGGTAQKINNAFFRFNLMEGLNRSFRVGATEAAAKFMLRHADGLTASGSNITTPNGVIAASAPYSRHSARWMKELGLQAGDVKEVNGRMALTAADGLTPEQVTRVHAALNQWVDGAVLRPDAADKPVWMNDPHYALIAHLKQFVYSFQKTIIDRVVHEFEHGNYSPVMALATYVPVMIAADLVKGLIQGGGDQPEWKKGWGMSDYVGYGVQRAGLLGVGQFGYDVMQNAERGGTGFGALVGPTFEQFGDVITALNGKKQYGPVVLHAMPANALYSELDAAPSPTLGG